MALLNHFLSPVVLYPVSYGRLLKWNIHLVSVKSAIHL